MEKVSVEIDLGDWEILSDDGFLDFTHHERVRKGKYSKEKGLGSKGVIRPFPTPRLIDIASSESENSGVGAVTIELEKSFDKSKKQEQEIELNKVPFVDISVIPPVSQDTVSRVFFKKMKENEFADMKMDSPKSPTKGLKLLNEAGSVQFEDKDETCNVKSAEYTATSEVITDLEIAKEDLHLDSNSKNKTNWEDNLNILGWRVTGVGALCCVGVAAATTICIFIFGGRTGNKKPHNHKIQFQVNSADKKNKQVHQEHILSQVMAAARGLSITEAQLYLEGY